MEFDAPGGWVRIDPENGHTWKTARIAQVGDEGQFVPKWSSDEPIEPDPFLQHGQTANAPPLAAVTAAQWLGLLQTGDVVARRRAARALALLEPSVDVARALGKSLGDRDWLVRHAAADALARFGPISLDAIIDALAVHDFRRALAARVAGSLGPSARRSVPQLVEALRSGDSETREESVRTLGRIGADAGDGVPAIVDALRDPQVAIRLRAMDTLGLLGSAAAPALPELRRALGDGTLGSRPRAADALVKIADDMERKEAPADLRQLEGALHDLNAFAPHDLEPQRKALALSIARLRVAEEAQWLDRSVAQMRANPWVVTGAVAAMAYVFALAFFGLLGLRWFPLWLLRANTALTFETPIPVFGMVAKIPLRKLLVVGWFHHHPRVLDAWVSQHLHTARRHFVGKDTVRDREVYVPLPVALDDGQVHEIGPAVLAATASETRWCVLIWGEGGSGKTSLACQIARSIMGLEGGRPPSPKPPMLPVLIEPGVGPESSQGRGLPSGDGPGIAPGSHRLGRGHLERAPRPPAAPAAGPRDPGQSTGAGRLRVEPAWQPRLPHCGAGGYL